MCSFLCVVSLSLLHEGSKHAMSITYACTCTTSPTRCCFNVGNFPWASNFRLFILVKAANTGETLAECPSGDT